MGNCVSLFKLLGVHVNDKLTWDDHVAVICKRASQRLYFITLLKRAGVQHQDLIAIYCSLVRSILEYAAVVWHPGLTEEQSKMIEHIQKRAPGIVFQESSYETALQRAGLQRPSCRREELCKNFFSELKQQNHVLHHLLPPRRPKMNLRHQREFETPKMRTFRLKKSPIFYGLFKFQ